ncbi:MAG TPA: hypothetical protein VMG31_11260 [Verrucomicrobiae bacterium]|nr:hypothetical protein [Verrucomicrobiae bacterium]
MACPPKEPKGALRDVWKTIYLTGEFYLGTIVSLPLSAAGDTLIPAFAADDG